MAFHRWSVGALTLVVVACGKSEPPAAPDAGDATLEAGDASVPACGDFLPGHRCSTYGKKCINARLCPVSFYELECGYSTDPKDICGMCWRAVNEPGRCPPTAPEAGVALDPSGCPLSKLVTGAACESVGKECYYRDLCPSAFVVVLYCSATGDGGSRVWRNREDPC